MAVATPVLERQSLQQSAMTDDELHNAQIKENYKRLINPELTINELRGGAVASGKAEAEEPAVRPSYRQTVQPQAARQAAYAPRQTAEQAPARFVDSARTDSALFRADSFINRRPETAGYAAAAAVQAPVIAPSAEEDENEDLRPTRTTIQYQTANELNISRERAVAEKDSAPVLGKREKIIIATFVSVVVALFILVIVNSAVIAGLNSELATMQGTVTAARETLENIGAQISSVTAPESIADYALSHGLYLY